MFKPSKDVYYTDNKKNIERKTILRGTKRT